MGTVKNAIYQVDNGTDFDEIHFKTNASQVQIQDTNNRFSSTNVEGALNELFQYANNGKSTIASSIGSPLISTDTFSAMGTKIGAIKSSLASAITNKGVSTSSWDTFDTMTAKISQINTGIRWATGTASDLGCVGSASMVVPMNLSFAPSLIFVYSSNFVTGYSYNNGAGTRNSVFSNIGEFMTVAGDQYNVKITNITSSSFTINFSITNNGKGCLAGLRWYAFE